MSHLDWGIPFMLIYIMCLMIGYPSAVAFHEFVWKRYKRQNMENKQLNPTEVRDE